MAGILAECAELHAAGITHSEPQADCHGTDMLETSKSQQEAADNAACYHCDSHCSSIKNLSPVASSALVYALVSSPDSERSEDTCNGYPRSLQRPPTLI